jgi:hypothetical protein
MRPEYILKTDLHEYLDAYRTAFAKQKRSRAAQGALDIIEEQIAHFGLTPGAKVTIIRDE